MTRLTMTTTRGTLRALTLLLALGLTACGKKEDAPASGSAAMASAENAEAQGGADAPERSYLAYEHSLTLDVPEPDIASLAARARQHCERDRANHCVLLDASLDSGRSASAELRFRAAPAGIQALIKDLGSQGDIASQTTHAEDLARPVQDVARKLAMLRSYQARLEELKVTAARDVDALVKIHKELAEVQTQLEGSQGEQAKLMERVDTELLTVRLHAIRHKAFFSPVVDAGRDFSGNLAQGISSVIVGLAFLLPWMLTLGVLAFVGRWCWRRWRRG